MFKLRDYQEECINKIKSLKPGKYLINMAVGLGKTVTFSRIPFKKHMLILSHREELVNQPRKYFDCSYGVEMGKQTSNGELVVSACVPSLIKRLNKFPKDYFDVIITDECFPVGTLIDNKPIENYKNGDIITSYNHKLNKIEYKKVLNTFKSIPKSIMIVKLIDGKEIICTGNHPFYTKQGYKPAINLNENDEVFYMSKRNNKCNTISKKFMVSNKTTTSILFKRMFKRILQKNQFRNDVKDQQKICIGKNEKKQSYEKSRIKKKNVRQIKRNWSLSENIRWKWSIITNATTKFIKCIKKIRTLCRICNPNKTIYKQPLVKWIFNSLQNRYSNNRLYDSYRNRWIKSYIIKKTRTRQEKRNNFNWIRVENIKIQKSTSDGTFGGLCKTGYVYNLEIQDNNNYFVNNILVHNCHHSVCKSYRTIYDYFQFDYHFGVTATPNRSDDVRLNSVFDEIVYQKDLKWGIKNNYLSDIYAMRFYMDYDLSKIKANNGDYQINQLEKAVNTIENATAIAEIYNKHAVGSTLIFGVSVKHCEELGKYIKGSAVITQKTKNRSEIINRFTSGEIKCLINCQIFTEGTDIPRVETLIIARPTKNQNLYCLDLKTEILTDNGWKTHETIDKYDKSASFNLKTNFIKYENIKNYIYRDLEINENYTSIKSNYIDIRVTNRHRMIYSTRNKKDWTITEAEKLTDLKNGFYVPVSGQFSYSGINLSDNEIKFIAWVKTDGNINKLNNAITITQSVKHTEYINEIEQIIINCGMKYNKIFNNGKTNFSEYREQYIFTISKGTPRSKDKHLKGWGYLENYFIGDNLWNMDNRQFDLFLDVCNKADGHKHKPKDWIKKTIDITKGNKEFIEKLQIACITRGYKANIKTFINNYKTEMYTIHIKKQSRKHLSSQFDNRPTFKNESFKNEKCWCIENETGTIITRRNGKVTIIGNCQMVGRGLRLYPGKKELLLIDCCGVTRMNLCTAPSLLGVDLYDDGKKKTLGRDELIEGNLFDLPEKIAKSQDKPDFWKINYKLVDLWAKGQGYNTHQINFDKMNNGDLSLSLPNINFIIKAPDELGKTLYHGKKVDMQEVIDKAYVWLNETQEKHRGLWDLSICSKWGKRPISEKQANLIKRFLPNYDLKMTSLEASQIINRLLGRKNKK